MYTRKTIFACGVSAFILCAFADTVFLWLGLLDADSSYGYGVYFHDEVLVVQGADRKKEGSQNNSVIDFDYSNKEYRVEN